jgi:transposase
MDKYIGLDVHATSCTAAVVDVRGKRLGSHVVETNGQALVEFFKTQAGTLHVCMEEGTQATWLAELLSAQVAEVKVTQVSESRGPKSDQRDAFDLADGMRTGRLQTSVFKPMGSFTTLRQLVKAHRMIVQDTVRVQNRIRALFRARGMLIPGKRRLYAKQTREEILQMLPASSRMAAAILFEQYDALCLTRDRAEKELVAESGKHDETRWLQTCPGVGEIRAARIAATVVTPDRFRTRAQYWAYCGLGIVTRSSSDWVRTPSGAWKRAPVQQTRGLNLNHNAMMKEVYKGAATTVIQQHPDEPLHKDYERMLAAGTKPNLAKLTLARKIAAITLAMWKKKEAYEPNKTSKP